MKRGLTLLSCTLMLGLLGCGGGVEKGPDLFPVKGKLTKGGEPGVGIVVTFIPADAKMPRPSGTVGDDGTFELIATANQPGATVGPHKVVLAFTPGEDAYNNPGAGGPPKAPFDDKWLTEQTTELTIDVPEGGKEDIVIELP